MSLLLRGHPRHLGGHNNMKRESLLSIIIGTVIIIAIAIITGAVSVSKEAHIVYVDFDINRAAIVFFIVSLVSWLSTLLRKRKK